MTAPSLAPARGRCQDRTALSPMKLAMMYTDRMEWETRDYFDITCPHGVVTWRLSRVRKARVRAGQEPRSAARRTRERRALGVRISGSPSDSAASGSTVTRSSSS